MHTNIKGYNFVVGDGFSDFWNYFKHTGWEKFTFDCIEKNKNGKMFWDIGAWIGPISLYASKLFDRVIAWEPDAIANEELKNNLSLNCVSNVSVIKKGIYNEETSIKFGCSRTGWGYGASSINNDIGEHCLINTMTLDKAAELYGRPCFVKIDIEGAEEYIMDDLIRHKFNRLHLSVHNDFIKELDTFLLKINKLIQHYNCWDWHMNELDIFDKHKDLHNVDLYLALK